MLGHDSRLGPGVQQPDRQRRFLLAAGRQRARAGAARAEPDRRRRSTTTGRASAPRTSSASSSASTPTARRATSSARIPASASPSRGRSSRRIAARSRRRTARRADGSVAGARFTVVLPAPTLDDERMRARDRRPRSVPTASSSAAPSGAGKSTLAPAADRARARGSSPTTASSFQRSRGRIVAARHRAAHRRPDGALRPRHRRCIGTSRAPSSACRRHRRSSDAGTHARGARTVARASWHRLPRQPVPARSAVAAALLDAAALRAFISIGQRGLRSA